MTLVAVERSRQHHVIRVINPDAASRDCLAIVTADAVASGHASRHAKKFATYSTNNQPADVMIAVATPT